MCPRPGTPRGSRGESLAGSTFHRVFRRRLLVGRRTLGLRLRTWRRSSGAAASDLTRAASRFRSFGDLLPPGPPAAAAGSAGAWAAGTGAAAPPNLFCSTPWFTTTARSRPVALSTVARRCAGELIRNSSLANISSLPGMVASCADLFNRSTLPSTMPSLKVNSALSLIQVESALANATGSPLV